MTRPKPAVRLTVVLALIVSALVALSATSSAQDPGPAPAEAALGDISQAVTPTAGVSGQEPSGVEAAPPATTNDGVEGQSLGPGRESVIGADGRIRVNPTTSRVARRIGQIEIDQGIFGTFLCTGWLVDDNSVLTAGHCVHDPSPVIGDLESATWYPGRNGGVDPYGGCEVETFFAPQQWIDNSSPQFDYALINFANPGPCAAIGQTLGTIGLMAVPTTRGLNGARAAVQGYPGDKPPGTMWKMNGRIAVGGRRMLYYPMDTFAGQSGSPVFWDRRSGPCTGLCGYGVHAYGANSGLPGPDEHNNSGPRFTAWRVGQIMSWADDNGG